MEWEEFCFKISNMLRHCENKIQLNCEADKITYIIENVKYTYTIDEFEGLKSLQNNMNLIIMQFITDMSMKLWLTLLILIHEGHSQPFLKTGC